MIAAGVVLVGGAVWYARAPTVPLIVAALISTQVVPLVGSATRRRIPRGLAVAAGFIGAVLIVAGLARMFLDSLFGSLARRR